MLAPPGLDPAQGWLLSPGCRDTPSHPNTYRSCNLPTGMLSYLLGLICSLHLENLSTLTPSFFRLAHDPAPLTFSSSSMLGLFTMFSHRHVSSPALACPQASPVPFREPGIVLQRLPSRTSCGGSCTKWGHLVNEQRHSFIRRLCAHLTKVLPSWFSKYSQQGSKHFTRHS